MTESRASDVGRRGFIGGAVGAALCGGAYGAEKGFKIGVCDWTLKKTADVGSLALAKRIGLDGVQVDLGSGAETDEALPLMSAELQGQFLAESKKTGVVIPSLAMGVLNSVPYKGDGPAEAWVEASVDVAVKMGVKVVLLAFFGLGDLRDDDAGKAKVVERLKKLMVKAEAAGVTYGIESWLTADELIEILDEVGSKNLKIYYDVGNMHRVRENIYSAIPKLGRDRICEFHAKDYDDLYGKGSIDFPRLRNVMGGIGYHGWVIMEGTKMPLGVEESNRYDADYL
ncbi:MAG: sugar phosphate isomerase/epimerase, partial [Verrucomicrobiales bacterium]|nr:sugar phosphate isomerase/epimerase [Verrucomicrobiales bacterium]